MNLQLDDTIVALSSAAGRGGRAIVRLSGPSALAFAECVFHSGSIVESDKRRIYSGFLALNGVSSPIQADLYVFPKARSFTDQVIVELHLLSSPPLVEQLLKDLMAAGARSAQPGEFTLRAFLSGKMDLSKAEAFLGAIEASDRKELQASLQQMAGGISRPLDRLRDDLLNLLADFEAGMDFAEEEHEFVGKPQILTRIAEALAQITLLQKQLRERSLPGRPFRAALVGPPNAGKSTLFNALTGSGALVSPVPGTTRDYLVARVKLSGLDIELIDTAGLRESASEIEREAHSVGRDAITRVDLVLLCRPGDDLGDYPVTTLAEVVPIATKSDLIVPPADFLACSATTGDGVKEVHLLLTHRAKARANRGLAPSLTRCSHHVERCLEHLRKAHQTVLFDEPAEVAALELRSSLNHLGEMTGAVYTDDLLDRVFSRFCIGK